MHLKYAVGIQKVLEIISLYVFINNVTILYTYNTNEILKACVNFKTTLYSKSYALF